MVIIDRNDYQVYGPIYTSFSATYTEIWHFAFLIEIEDASK